MELKKAVTMASGLVILIALSGIEPAKAFDCNVRKSCGKMASCEEATYHLNVCRNGRLDKDGDGVPCESLCKNSPSSPTGRRGQTSSPSGESSQAPSSSSHRATHSNPTVYSCKTQTGQTKLSNSPCPKDPPSGGGSKSYDRADWPHWIDADGDCQDTRTEILIRDSTAPVKFKRNQGCNVSWGQWVGPYTGQVFTKASDVDIDHVIPLSHAHKTGGAVWSREKKREFANDPENLLTVDDSTNQGKGDKGPAQWKPPLKTYWCEYARRWRRIKGKYGLTISTPEESSLNVMERTCG